MPEANAKKPLKLVTGIFLVALAAIAVPQSAKEMPTISVAMDQPSSFTAEQTGLKEVKIGGLKALVPKTMVTVDSHFTTQPNLYDGLPQEAKVLFLLSTLTPAQWAKATGDGIGLAECQGEQRAVMQSIIPNPVRYTTGFTEPNGFTNSNDPNAKKLLPDKEREAIKIRIVRNIELGFGLKNDGGYTGSSLDDENKPGTEMRIIDDQERGEYGHQVLVYGPNSPRKSELSMNDPRMATMVPFAPGDQVGTLLARIATATGTSIIADPHFRSLPVNETGTGAAARDILQAVSLGVAGTYRRLGDTYILTNDLEGMAVHQSRIALWEESLQREVQAREAQWRKAIAKTDGLARMKFSNPAFEALTNSELDNLNSNDKVAGEPRYYPVSTASPAIGAAIKNYQGGNDIDRDKIGLSSSVRYQIIMPDGKRAWWAGSIGNREQFSRTPQPWAPPNPDPVPLPLASSPTGLILHADSVVQVKRLVARVARLGIRNLWLETSDANSLSTAVEAGTAAGIKVSLAVRPWTLPTSDPDRNVYGDHGTSLAAFKSGLEFWQNLWQAIAAYEPPTDESMSPLDPAVPNRIAQWSRLAQTQGIDHIVLLDLYPSGYALDASNVYGSYFYSNSIEGALALGYRPADRQAFLRQENTDPLDIENDSVRTDVDLRDAWNGATLPNSDFKKWQGFRGKAANASALSLAQALAASNPSASLLLTGQAGQTHLPPLGATYLWNWSSAVKLPILPEDFGSGETAQAADVAVVKIQDDHDPRQRNRVAARLIKLLNQSEKPTILDFSSVPSDQLEVVLARWLKDK